MINYILAKIRISGDIALAVASSGIAAQLLMGGRTAHSKLKLPLNVLINETPFCNIKKNSPLAEVLRRTKAIVWDEVSMSHKRLFEALDRSLQDIRDNDTIFGGVPVIAAGDFRFGAHFFCFLFYN